MEFSETVYILKVIRCDSEGAVCDDFCLLENYVV
jgi:hypothetical protein